MRHERLMGIVKNDLNVCLLHNCRSTSPLLQRLSCSIFVVVLRSFRHHLKALVRPRRARVQSATLHCATGPG